jgi:hypothetical protein
MKEHELNTNQNFSLKVDLKQFRLFSRYKRLP